MTLREILDVASRNYPDCWTRLYYNDDGSFHDNPTNGDTLAEFIVREIVGTYYEDCSWQEQLLESIRVMRGARDELERIFYALDELHDKVQDKTLCDMHSSSLAWDSCTEGDDKCEVEAVRKLIKEASTLNGQEITA
jgi:hypothetical protein